MPKLKINPINIDKSTTAKGIGQNIGNILDFLIALANDTNRVIAEINEAMPDEIPIYDDSNLKAQLKKAQSETVKKLESLVDKSELESKISSINIPDAYDDSSLQLSIESLNSKIESLAYDIAEIKKATILNQSELRSSRKTVGYQIDVLDQKLNKLTEVK